MLWATRHPRTHVCGCFRRFYPTGQHCRSTPLLSGLLYGHHSVLPHRTALCETGPEAIMIWDGQSVFAVLFAHPSVHAHVFTSGMWTCSPVLERVFKHINSAACSHFFLPLCLSQDTLMWRPLIIHATPVCIWFMLMDYAAHKERAPACFRGPGDTVSAIRALGPLRLGEHWENGSVGRERGFRDGTALSS